MAAELDFDLHHVDLNLQHLDGVPVLHFLRTRKPSMSGARPGAPGLLKTAFNASTVSTDDYLGKPFSFTEFVGPNPGV